MLDQKSIVTIKVFISFIPRYFTEFKSVNGTSACVLGDWSKATSVLLIFRQMLFTFSQFVFFFSVWAFFEEHSRFTGQQGKGEAFL